MSGVFIEIRLLVSNTTEHGWTDLDGCYRSELPYPSGWLMNITVKKGGKVIYNNIMYVPNMWIWDAEALTYNPIVIYVGDD